jgi:hypothetical protein
MPGFPIGTKNHPPPGERYKMLTSISFYEVDDAQDYEEPVRLFNGVGQVFLAVAGVALLVTGVFVLFAQDPHWIKYYGGFAAVCAIIALLCFQRTRRKVGRLVNRVLGDSWHDASDDVQPVVAYTARRALIEPSV